MAEDRDAGSGSKARRSVSTIALLTLILGGSELGSDPTGMI